MEIYENLSLEDMEGEVWKDIEGFEGVYQISNMGRVKSLERKCKSGLHYSRCTIVKQKIRKQNFTPNGYLCVLLSRNGKDIPISPHRMVAKHFIPNPENKPTVDHINTIKYDNRVENLRWFTNKEQMVCNRATYEKVKKVSAENGKRACKIMNEANKRKIRCSTTGKEFDSVKEASEYYNISRPHISSCCKGKRKSCGKLPDGTKLQWEYID